MGDSAHELELIMPAAEIFDTAAFQGKVQEWSDGALKMTDIRQEAIGWLSESLARGKAAIAETGQAEFRINPYASLQTVQSFTYLTDCLVRSVFDLSVGILN
ncbi:MAG: hypothetical protein OXC91_12985, partial [Rhodobacteraceae bacterium]|nr:hypothetical protein [Paracoccaceae bacterium]